MLPQLLRCRAVAPLGRRFALCTFLVAPGCAGEENSEDGVEAGTEGETGASESQDSGGPEAIGDDSIRGTFVFRDGSEAELNVAATYRRFEFGGVVQHNCEGSDVEAGLSLGITWREDTAVGMYAVSLADGPGFIAAWPQVDGSGIRATLPSDGELNFESIGMETGDVVAGTARALLHPEADDPDDRVLEISEIEFRCTVREPE